MVGLTLSVLVFVRHWIVDTSTERTALAAAQRQAQDERTTYIAAKAAVVNEHQRLTRDVAAARAAISATLASERSKMRAEFKEERATLSAEAFQTGVEMERAGMLKPGAQIPAGKLIRFPQQGGQEQAPEPQGQRERAQEHGAVGP
jgi:hypothetical protein